MNSAAKVNQTAELLVRVPPQWVFEPQNVSTLLGSPLIVNCKADGFPPPSVNWLRSRGRSANNYQPLIAGLDGRLTILPNDTLWTASAEPQDEGHYLCRANNSIGSGLSKVIYVSVNGKNPITLKCFYSFEDMIFFRGTNTNTINFLLCVCLLTTKY